MYLFVDICKGVRVHGIWCGTLPSPLQAEKHPVALRTWDFISLLQIEALCRNRRRPCMPQITKGNKVASI